MGQVIEFMFNGANVRVEMQPKQVVVNFFGQRFQFGATQAALRDRVRAEIRKAGLSRQLEKVINREAATARKRK